MSRNPLRQLFTISALALLGVAHPGVARDITGTWVREAPAAPGVFEALVFEPNGTLGVAGVPRIVGISWRREEDGLFLTTNSERNPDPLEYRLKIQSLREDRLILHGQRYLAGRYQRNDDAVGTVSGTVVYRERIALPPDAVYIVRLDDVSLQDVAADTIAQQVQVTDGRQVPLPFRLYYVKRRIEERNTYALNARITFDGQLQFINTTRQRWIPFNRGPVTIRVDQISALKRRRP